MDTPDWRAQDRRAQDWRRLSPVALACEKQPATGRRGMVVTNHPLATAAGTALLAAGGNAVDAAVGALFALTVVEPMMVGILGGGLMHLRLPGESAPGGRPPEATHLVLDGLSTAPAAARPDMFPMPPGAGPRDTESAGRRNAVGAAAVATPGNLVVWLDALSRFGRLGREEVLAPAIDLAARGFRVTRYLSDCVREAAADLAADPVLSPRFVPDGTPIPPDHLLQQPDVADALRLVASDGAAALHGGPLGALLCRAVSAGGGVLAEQDLARYRGRDRALVRAPYRGWEVLGPPPPAASGVHVGQMLALLEGFDVRALGFGTPAGAHLLAEILKAAFADRAAATADPDFVSVPTERLLSPAYAAERRALFDPAHARAWTPGVPPATPLPGTHSPGLHAEGANTTHLTVADAEGRVVCATHTINSLFGARLGVPGCGLLANNYMRNFDPRPGRAQSIAPGKRIPTSMAPLMVLRDGRIEVALGLPGGLRIFPSALQAVLNLLDHGMTLQEAVEAPRLWCDGGALELEPAFPPATADALRTLGHDVQPSPHVGGGMNAIRFHADGTLEGAACWRADGTAAGLGGGLARPGVRFWPDQAPAR